MTTEEVQKALETALLHFQDAVIPEVPERIKAVTTIGGSHLVVTFDDGTMARLDIGISPAPKGGQS